MSATCFSFRWATTRDWFKPSEVPKTYEDLLNPRWKGQMMWSTRRGSGAPMFIGNVLQSMGQEKGKAYLQKLKAQNIAKTTASNRQLLGRRAIKRALYFPPDSQFNDGNSWVEYFENSFMR